MPRSQGLSGNQGGGWRVRPPSSGGGSGSAQEPGLATARHSTAQHVRSGLGNGGVSCLRLGVCVSRPAGAVFSLGSLAFPVPAPSAHRPCTRWRGSWGGHNHIARPPCVLSSPPFRGRGTVLGTLGHWRRAHSQPLDAAQRSLASATAALSPTPSLAGRPAGPQAQLGSVPMLHFQGPLSPSPAWVWLLPARSLCCADAEMLVFL